jgi:hypothetical protein
MAPHLLTELIIRIICLAAPLDPILGSRERRTLLRRLSLVSKVFCAIAQPMLPEVFEFRCAEDIEALRVDCGGSTRGSRVRTLIADPRETYDENDELGDFCHVPLLVELCPNTETFSLNSDGGAEWLDLSFLAKLTGSSLSPPPVAFCRKAAHAVRLRSSLTPFHR